MINKICKCGHDNTEHKTGECFYVLKKNLEHRTYCPCKKFEPQEVEFGGVNFQRPEKHGYKPKNHNESEVVLR